MDMAEVWDPSPEWYRKEKQIEATIADKLAVEPKEVEQRLNIKKRKKEKKQKKYGEICEGIENLTENLRQTKNVIMLTNKHICKVNFCYKNET